MVIKPHATILFQGDSITDGGRNRKEDLNHVMGHSYAYVIASQWGAEYADRQFSFLNRGISGNRIVDLFARWQEDTLNLQPDVLSILIGVNDVGREINAGSGVSAEKFEKVYRLLLEESKSADSDLIIVLCEPFILPAGPVKENWEKWSEEIKKRQQVVRQMAEEFQTIHVPLQDAFNKACEQAEASYWIWDGVHPTPAGHGLIAREWMKCVAGK